MRQLYLSYLQTEFKQLYYTAKEVNKFILENRRPYPIPYVARRHHGAITPQEVLQNPDEGANCEASAYAIAMLLGKQPPPPGLRASQFLDDSGLGTTVEDIQTGDIIGQQMPERSDLYGTHLSVAWVNQDGERFVVHNVNHIGFLTVQPLDEALATHPTHTRLVAIRRLPENPDTYNPDALRRLGLGFMLGEEAA